MATLLQFTVGNCLSFSEKKTFEMIASSIKDDPITTSYLKIVISISKLQRFMEPILVERATL